MGLSLPCTMMNQPEKFYAQFLAWTLTLADTSKIASDFFAVCNNQSSS